MSYCQSCADLVKIGLQRGDAIADLERQLAEEHTRVANMVTAVNELSKQSVGLVDENARLRAEVGRQQAGNVIGNAELQSLYNELAELRASGNAGADAGRDGRDGEGVDSKWQGDLDDDCFLDRYGMFAHVEKLDRHHWWFAISDGREVGRAELYNFANMRSSIRLTTGWMARAAAECMMELLSERAAIAQQSGGKP